MKKKLWLLLPILLLTGCVKIDNSIDNFDLLLSNTLNTNIIQNRVSNGYKYYLPKGVNLESNLDFNQIFNYNDVHVYMYIDIVGYYYKINNINNIIKTEDYLYYKEINNGDKIGYLLIREENNIYYVNILYNYGKIELYTNKENLNNIIAESLIILNSITYNDTIIETIINNNLVNYEEIDYELNKPNDSTSNFDKYLSEYVQKETAVVELPED